MNIVFVTPDMNCAGAERVMSVLSNDWVKKGHGVSIIITQTEAESGYPLDPRVRLTSIRSCASRPVPHFGLIRAIRKICKSEKPDCVISFYNDVCALTAIALRKTGIPLFYSERNDPNRVNQRLVDRVYRKIVEKKSRGVVFQTDGAKACYNEKTQRKSTVIVNPVDVSDVPARNEKKEEKYIVSVGRLTEQKRHDVEIDAFALIADDFPDYRLKIFGAGNLENVLRERVKKAGLSDRVIFCGNVPDVMHRVAESSLFVMTSDYEGIPNALAEAMAIGVPCISTDCSPGGARMFIRSGENGLIVPCGDVSAAADSMRKLLSDRELAEKLGENAKKIRTLVDIDRVSEKWLEFIAANIN